MVDSSQVRDPSSRGVAVVGNFSFSSLLRGRAGPLSDSKPISIIPATIRCLTEKHSWAWVSTQPESTVSVLLSGVSTSAYLDPIFVFWDVGRLRRGIEGDE